MQPVEGNGTMKLLGEHYPIVRVNDATFGLAHPAWPGWFLGPNAILELRGVAASILWIIDNLGDACTGELLADYFDGCYPATDFSAEAGDYHLLFRLVARFLDADNFRAAAQTRSLKALASATWCFDTAAWYALHTSVRFKDGRALRDSMALRFGYAVQELTRRFASGERTDPRCLLDELDASPRARDLEFIPLDEAISGAIEFVEQARKRMKIIHDSGAAGHFAYTTETSLRGLDLRRNRRWLEPLTVNLFAFDPQTVWIAESMNHHRQSGNGSAFATHHSSP